MLRRAVFACAVAAGCAAAFARADPGEELVRLRDEAAQMRRSLDALDAKIRALEAEMGDPRAGAGRAPTPDADAVPSARNWPRIERGLASDRVEALLGKPGRVLRIDGSLVWYYAYPDLGRGSVFFDGSGRVSSVQAPRAGW